MTTNSSIKRFLRIFVVLILLVGFDNVALSQRMASITLRGFNHDVIAEGNGQSSLAKTSLEMDAIVPSNFVMFSKQFAVANKMPLGYGLPDNGRIANRLVYFVLQPYTNNNALYLLGNQSGRLKLVQPKKYSQLSILGLGTEGGAVIAITLKFTDSTSQEIRNQELPDWFDGPQPFLAGFGRVKRSNGSASNPLYYEGAPANPRMYTINISVPSEKVLAYIQFRNIPLGGGQASNRAFIFAVSGVEPIPPPQTIPSEKEVITEKTITPVEKKTELGVEKVIPVAPPTFNIHGTVVDVKTNKPVQAALNFMGEKTLSVTCKENGEYNQEFPTLTEYTIKVEARGYVGILQKVNLSQVAGGDLSFRMEPIAVGTLVKLNSILFEQSSFRLKEESYLELDQVVDFLKNNPNVSIKLGGHTDNRGDKKLNLKLSNDRVMEVKKYLVTKGIDATRISGKGYGGSKPLAKGNNEEAWKLNRRVEFTITKM
jgi:outer membrane protein OmpA-like peptidoglycan-associated protein